MNKTPEQLIEVATRHQVYLEKYKSGVFKQYDDYLKEMAKIIKLSLAGKELSDYSRSDLNKLIKMINLELTKVQSNYNKELTAALVVFAVYEAGFEIRALNQIVKYKLITPTESRLKIAALTNPIVSKGFEGQLLEPFIKGMSAKEINGIANMVRSGVYEKLTTHQIIINILGTKKLKHTDGKFAQLYRAVDLYTKTALQHVAMQAREETWKANDDIIKGVQWVSTLDFRTSSQCRGLDGEVFEIGKGVRPPIHLKCRSSTVAVLDDKFAILDKGKTRAARSTEGKHVSVSAKSTYYDWLKRQPANFQDDVVGKTRGQLLRNGGLSSKRFTELQLNRRFHPITLDEMKKLEPNAFEKIGI